MIALGDMTAAAILSAEYSTVTVRRGEEGIMLDTPRSVPEELPWFRGVDPITTRVLDGPVGVLGMLVVIRIGGTSASDGTNATLLPFTGKLLPTLSDGARSASSRVLADPSMKTFDEVEELANWFLCIFLYTSNEKRSE